MDTLHLYGIDIIRSLQTQFQSWSSQMMFASHLGDPRNAFLVYFPLTFFLSPKLGVTVMWVAAISEWQNAVFKWLLFGHRPYWWVSVSDLYPDESRPNLTQYHLTCETGPGSPSGHAMITAAVLFPVFLAVANQSLNKSYKLLTWLLFGLFMFAVSVSRLFIATHFPHQVLAGVIVGSLMGYVAGSFKLLAARLHHYILWGLIILITSPGVVWVVGLLGWDASWSVLLAKQWCAHAKWVYLDTTPMYSITRDAGQLIGMGFAYTFTKQDFASAGSLFKVLSIALSLMFARGMEYVALPHTPYQLFYVLAFAKNAVLPIVIVLVIPKLLGLFITPPKVKNG